MEDGGLHSIRAQVSHGRISGFQGYRRLDFMDNTAEEEDEEEAEGEGEEKSCV